MNSKRIDLVVGTALIIFSTAVFFYAGQYKGAGVFQYGPNFFPQVLAVMMFIASIALVVNALRGLSIPLPDSINRAGFIRAAVSLGITVFYLVLMQIVGFIIATALFLFAQMTYIGHKGLVVRLTACIAVTAIIYSIFYYFLKIPIPNGILF